MRKTIILYMLVSLTALLTFTSVSLAQEECPSGQVQKCFVDGTNSNCVCMAEPTEVEANPEAEPDGQINEDGGGQEDE